MKILIYGAGYVGLSNGLALATKNDVNIIDINSELISRLSNKEAFLEEEYTNKTLKDSSAVFTTSPVMIDPDLILLALPTNYDEKTESFDTRILDDTINSIIQKDPDSQILIKSTVPIGYSDKFKSANITFSPEFLREGSSLNDCLNPDRIVVGNNNEKIANLYKDIVLNDPEIIITDNKTAETVKLFANTYLATRVAFVNELSNFTARMGIDTKLLLNAIGADKRIGKHYFYPSAGFGGYCLPKDSKQLVSEFDVLDISNNVFNAIIDSNDLRIEHLINLAKSRNIKNIAINGIGHKPGVINTRSSRKHLFAKKALEHNINVIYIDNTSKLDEVEGIQILKEKPKDFIWLETLY